MKKGKRLTLSRKRKLLPSTRFTIVNPIDKSKKGRAGRREKGKHQFFSLTRFMEPTGMKKPWIGL